MDVGLYVRGQTSSRLGHLVQVMPETVTLHHGSVGICASVCESVLRDTKISLQLDDDILAVPKRNCGNNSAPVV